MIASGFEFQVNMFTTGVEAYPSVGAGPNGSFVVVWPDLQYNEIKARRFSATGSPLGLEIAVATESQKNPVVGVLPNGSFVVYLVGRL